MSTLLAETTVSAHASTPALARDRDRAAAPRILMPSIVDPTRPTLGAATVTRGLLRLLKAEPLCARIQCVSVPAPPPSLRRLRQAASLARSMVSPFPSKAEFGRSKRFRQSLRRQMEEHAFDAVLLNGSDLLWLLDDLPASLPLIVVAHNIEHRLFASQVRSVTWAPPPLRCLLDRDSARLRQYEVSGFERVHNVIFLSSEDAAYAAQADPSLNALVQPPVFDYPPHPRRVPIQLDGPLDIGFVANLSWWPNRDGIEWFLKSVLPHVNSRVRLHLFGEGSQALADLPHVKAHGFVPNPARIWDICHFVICPVFAGGGVSIKVAEAIYNRVPVVATPFAVRAMPPLADAAVVVLDGAVNWISFLRSRQARELAGRRVSRELAGWFHAPPYRRAFQKYFLEVLRQGRAHEC